MKIVGARKEFAEFVTTDVARDAGAIDYIASEIRELLTKAGVDAAALDETGQSSAEDMEARIEQAVARASLVSARKEFAKFETTDVAGDAGSIDYIASEIRKLLTKAGVDAAALDETGQSSAEDMEARIEQAVAGASLVSARKEFAKFETTDVTYSESSIAHIASTIRGLFAKAGTDASALDPTGEFSATQMEARIEQAAERARGLTRKGGPT